MESTKRTIQQMGEEATNLGMTPEEAGLYIEQEWEAQEIAAELAEAEYLSQE